jgi:methylated-DNA-[protein]-cysteine S-methyltransferase
MPIITHLRFESPLGTLTLVNADGVLSGLYMDDPSRGPGVEEIGTPTQSGFEAAVGQLQEYFAGQRTRFELPISMVGTPFQRRVWDALKTVPYGETRSYAQVAKAIGNPAAMRAVGLANGKNPISIIVPCHRVIGSDGSLTGYGGGLERKRFLLDLESRVARRQARLF